MFETMYRLHPRGAANRGVCVDTEGAMLGPDCVLVQRAQKGYRAAPRSVLRSIQDFLLKRSANSDWLFEQSRRVADALNRGDVALAQIYGLRIPIGELDGGQLKQLAVIAPLTKAGFNPDEPRVPADQPDGGEWADGGDNGVAATPWSVLRFDEKPSPSSSPFLIGGRWPAPTGANANPLFHPAQAEEDESGRGGLLGNFMDLPIEFRQELYEALSARLEEIDPENPALQTLTGPDYSPTQADIDALGEALSEAQVRTGQPPATEWDLGWGARGVALEQQRLGGQRILPFNAPTIDAFPNDVAVSIKSIDLNAPWYSNSLNLSRQIDRYVDQLWAFDSMSMSGIKIEDEDIKGKVLDIVIPKNSGTQAQQDAIARSIERAQKFGIHVFVSGY